MAAPSSRFVQFPHPGGEHTPVGDHMAWNVGAHRRKFLSTPGRYVAADGHDAFGELTLWGEWEPPSRVVRRWPTNGRLPRVLHRPYWVRPRDTGFRQNTDPWIWGERMLYSNCKQLGPHSRPTSMQKLPRGSVVCFGSTMDGEFCVDTVFVVASAEPWVPAEASRSNVSDVFVVCTGDSITADGIPAQIDLTLYRGATVDEPVDGMYSFVPARRADPGGPPFTRPALRLPGLINPASKQSTWGYNRPLTSSTIRLAWQSVRNQVFASGAVLAVRIDTPPEEVSRDTVPATGRSRC